MKTNLRQLNSSRKSNIRVRSQYKRSKDNISWIYDNEFKENENIFFITKKFKADMCETAFKKNENIVEKNIKKKRNGFQTQANQNQSGQHKVNKLLVPKCVSNLLIKMHQRNHSEVIVSQDANLLQKLLKSHKINGMCLMGKNILYFQEKYEFSRYELHNMYSFYNTLIEFSNGSIKKYIKAFQLILSMEKINLKQQIIKQELSSLKKISFQSFVATYYRFKQLIYKQIAVDYLDILLQSCNPWKISYSQLETIIKNRNSESQELQLIKVTDIFIKIGKNQNSSIKKAQLVSLCYEDNDICQTIYKMYLKEFAPNKGTIL